MSLDFNTIMQVAELAVAVETGGTSALLTTAAQQAVSQVATQAFSGALSHMHLSGSEQSAATSAFSAAFGAATGSSGSSSQLSQQVLDAAARNGGLANSQQQLSSSMESLMTDALGSLGQQNGQGQGSSGGSGATGANWMEAIAKAMGDALGKLSQQVVDESQQLDSLAGDSSSTGAQQFQSTMAKFQADSQTLGMLSDAFANAIKSIGQGLQTMASKNS